MKNAEKWQFKCQNNMNWLIRRHNYLMSLTCSSCLELSFFCIILAYYLLVKQSPLYGNKCDSD